MRPAAQQFSQDGYIFIKGLLSAEEVHTYKSLIQQLSGLTDADFNAAKARFGGWAKPDAVTQEPEFWPLIFHERLLGCLREILGPSLRYTQHSDLHVHHGTVGWHRDCASRVYGVGPDWDESCDKYQIVRVAIYLQSYSESGFALGVIPGSHRYESSLMRLERKGWNLLFRLMHRQDLLPKLLAARPVWIKTGPGDCIIFDQRLLHSGNHIHGPKYAIFLSYGAENEHSRRHRRYYLQERKELRYEDYPAELAERLQQENLYLPI